jgi:hypothetical protein
VAKAEEPVTLVKVMEMVDVPNMVEAEEEGAVVLPTLTTPMMKNKAEAPYLEQEEAVEVVLEQVVLVRI